MMIYARVTAWLPVQHLNRRMALIALVFALPSLAVGLVADDYLLHDQVMKGGPFAAYLFTARGEQASHAQTLEQRTAGQLPWWNDEHPHARYFRPLSSVSLWLDFAHGAPPWWMHLENCVIYAAITWLATAIYAQLGLSGAGLIWAALFFALDLAFAAPVGWIAARNTLLATCFGFACFLLHDRARRRDSPGWLALACVCFVLSLLSAELGLCTLGFVLAHALVVDRASPWRRVLALSPYGVLVALYLVHYVRQGYGMSSNGVSPDVVGAPGAALLSWVGAIPVWLATTITLPFAGFYLIVPGARLPIVVASLVILALLVPLMAAYCREHVPARLFSAGALLSLVPLATTFPQERLRFFVALGVYGVLGPWVVRCFDARERVRRIAARTLWSIHGVMLPLLFVPSLFAVGLGFASGGSQALDRALPRAAEPITILLNPPNFYGPLFQAAMRSYRGEPRPAVFMLYAGAQTLEVTRLDVRTLELYVARGWFATPFDGFRDLKRWPFHVGDLFALRYLTVEVREIDARGAPTRARFTFDRALGDPSLAFRYWDGSDFTRWTPPAVGSPVRLSAGTAF
ncbi:MAG: hypothetical protein ABW321_01635 [Polyangiales bacterium]